MIFFSDSTNETPQDEHLPSDFEVDEISSDPETLAYGLYSILTTYKNHFQNLQNKFKALSVTWVLATFIGIGYIISGYEFNLKINVFLIIMFLSLLAAQGVFLLWFLDVGIYDKLIKSVWLEIYKLEEKFPLIGKSHHHMAKLLSYDKKSKNIYGFFYIYFVTFFIFIAFICLGFYLYYIKPVLILLTLPLACIIAYLLYVAIKKIFYRN